MINTLPFTHQSSLHVIIMGQYKRMTNNIELSFDWYIHSGNGWTFNCNWIRHGYINIFNVFLYFNTQCSMAKVYLFLYAVCGMRDARYIYCTLYCDIINENNNEKKGKKTKDRRQVSLGIMWFEAFSLHLHWSSCMCYTC